MTPLHSLTTEQLQREARMKKPTAVEQGNRMRAANDALKAFAADTWLTFVHGYVVVCWRQSSGQLFERRWMTRGQSFYPTWYGRWCHGGTACTALAQLVRWIQGKPVLPGETWRWWANEKVKLIAPTAVDQLLAAGYPEKAVCVLCGIEPISMDWWSLDGVSGPCCGWTTGCRQKKATA